MTNLVLSDYLNCLTASFERQLGNNLQFVVQFGSSCKTYLKTEFDVDCLVVVASEIKKSKWNAIVNIVEQDLSIQTEELGKKNFRVELSPILRIEKNLKQPSSFFFDFVGLSKILFERDGTGAKFLDRVQSEIVRRNDEWTWV